MTRLTFQEFLAVRDEFDAAVQTTPGISQFCSSTSWAIPAFRGLHEFDPETTETFIVREGDSWIVFVEKTPNYFYPFESAWMFQCPVIGPNAVDLLTRAKTKFLEGPNGFVIGGLPKNGTIFEKLKSLNSLQFENFPTTDSMIIDLETGFDEWLTRRSKKFRRTIRDAQKNCADVKIDEVAPDFDRLFAIQEQTYKWEDGSDIFHHDDCRKFYQTMIESEQTLRLRIAIIDGEDAGFLLGAVFGNKFRGLQMSYIEKHKSLGLGNYLQIETLKQMSEVESVTVYDLGMFSEYKSRWADETREFVGCFVVL